MHSKTFLYIGGYGIFFLFVIAAVMLVRKRFSKRRPPLEFEYNRLPGESLTKRIESDNEKLLWVFFLCLLTPLAAILILHAVFLFAYPTVSHHVFIITLSIGFLCALATASWALVKEVIKISKLELGLNGERIVADFLRPLEREGWRVFHDVPARQNGKDFNLDHVAIGPGGVVLIETKTRSKGKTIEGRKDNVVRFDGEKLIWPWGHSKSELQQLTLQRKWLESWLEERTGIKTTVSPVLAIPGWWTESTNPKARTKVVSHKSICDAVKGRGEPILDSNTIDLLSRQLESICRIKA